MTSRSNPFFILILVGLFWLAILSISLSALYRDEQFEQSTHQSTATVERNWTTHGSKGGVHYHLSYHFPDDQGRVWTVDTYVAQGTYERVRTGAVVPVKYLENDPSQSRVDWPVEVEFHWHKDKILFYIALGIAVFLVLIAWSNIRYYRSRR